MKRQVFPVLILLVVLLLPALTGCPQDAGDGGDEGNTPSGNYGDNLPTLTGKVYTETLDYMVNEVSYAPSNASGTVRAWVNGWVEGSLADGNFTISITEEPDSDSFLRFDAYYWFSNWGGGKITIDPPEAQYASLGFSVYEDGTYTGNISKGKVTITSLGNVDRKVARVYYWYVDRDVTVTLEEGSIKNDWWDTTYEAGELKFLKGWNALYEENHEIFTDERPSPASHSFSVEDPEDLYWVFSPPYEEE